eukprot:TRINITY_DN120283_c1_g1_i1.p6 TRINITY_DN120283_c1_g1~~TRINITY_DN120283_c1_g1_i1.p6  ORF type:complete len:114 (+),score=4.12 TRINITY_DN120283_c1_g1_i1:1422-1763(+)
MLQVKYSLKSMNYGFIMRQVCLTQKAETMMVFLIPYRRSRPGASKDIKSETNEITSKMKRPNLLSPSWTQSCDEKDIKAVKGTKVPSCIPRASITLPMFFGIANINYAFHEAI